MHLENIIWFDFRFSVISFEAEQDVFLSKRYVAVYLHPNVFYLLITTFPEDHKILFNIVDAVLASISVFYIHVRLYTYKDYIYTK